MSNIKMVMFDLSGTTVYVDDSSNSRMQYFTAY